MQYYLSKIPGQFYLWFAVIIFGASGSVTRKLTQLGAMQFMNGHNPISLCNVLFVGNICALGIMLMLYRTELTAKKIAQISRSEWVNLTIVAILGGALAPAAIFQALALAPVNSIILLGRLEVPVVLVLSRFILGEQLAKRQKIGIVIVLVGLVIAVTGNSSITTLSSFTLGKGELLTIAASIFSSISILISKQKLADVSVGIYGIFRTGLGSLIFFVLAIFLYGSQHFGEAFSPFLWKWMLVYGAIIVVIGQSFWIKGFRESPISTSAIVSCFYPIAAMLFAYWILAELPTMGQVIGGLILLVGLLLSQSRVNT